MNVQSDDDEDIFAILNMLLVVERLTTTFYYKGLTTPAVMRSKRLAGASANPNAPGWLPNGNPPQVRYLKAALDAEVKHATALERAGARSHVDHFYFPATTFADLGPSSSSLTFLNVLDWLETSCAGAYIVAMEQFLRLGRPDLGMVAARVMGVEAEHRTLGRVIAGRAPANNLVLEATAFAGLNDVRVMLQPFLTGRRFRAGSTPPLKVPTATQTAAVIGTYATHTVVRF